MSFIRNHFKRCVEAPASTEGCRSANTRDLVRRANRVLRNTTEEQLEWIVSELDELVESSIVEPPAGSNAANFPGIAVDDCDLDFPKVVALVDLALAHGHRNLLWDRLLLPEECISACFAVITLAIANILESEQGMRAGTRAVSDHAMVIGYRHTRFDIEASATNAIEYAERGDRSGRQKQRPMNR